MASNREISVQTQQRQLTILMFIGGLFFFISASVLWFHYVFNNPPKIFWDMIDANLKSYGQSQQVLQSNEDKSVSQDQTTRLQLGAQNVAQSRAVLHQNNNTDKKIAITTETINTPTSNYVHYADIQLGPGLVKDTKPNFEALENTWAKDNQNAESSIFLESVFGSLGTVPTYNLSAQNRRALIAYMRDKEVYQIDYTKVKTTKQGGRTINTYTVTVNPQKYISMLKLFDQLSGLNRLGGVDPAQFSGSQPIVANLSVDILSRNLVAISYADSGNVAKVSAHGAFVPVALPANTVPASELQQQLQTILQLLQPQQS